MIKPPYKQALVGMGWNAGGPRELEEKKKKKDLGDVPEKRKKEKYPGDKCLLGLVLGSVVVACGSYSTACESYGMACGLYGTACGHR
jgi:hypothetical protein